MQNHVACASISLPLCTLHLTVGCERVCDERRAGAQLTQRALRGPFSGMWQVHSSRLSSLFVRIVESYSYVYYRAMLMRCGVSFSGFRAMLSARESLE